MVQLFSVFGLDCRVGLASAGLVVEPEYDGEAPGLAYGVGARKGNKVFYGEVEFGEEGYKGGGIGSWAWHDVV